MKVQCQTVDARSLLAEHYAAGYSDQTDFGQTLAVDEVYTVYGVCVWVQGLVLYLLDPSGTSVPSWYPAELFRIVDAGLAPAWRAWHRPDSSYHVVALFGYYELVEDASHYDALLERDSVALRLFGERRREADLVR